MREQKVSRVTGSVRAERLDGPDVGKPKPKPDPKGQDRPPGKHAPSNGVSPKRG